MPPIYAIAETQIGNCPQAAIGHPVRDTHNPQLATGNWRKHENKKRAAISFAAPFTFNDAHFIEVMTDNRRNGNIHLAAAMPK